MYQVCVRAKWNTDFAFAFGTKALFLESPRHDVHSIPARSTCALGARTTTPHQVPVGLLRCSDGSVINIFSVDISCCSTAHQTPFHSGKIREKETASVRLLSFRSPLHWFVQSSYPQWDRNDVPPHVIQTPATVSVAKSQRLSFMRRGRRKDSAGFCVLLTV